MSIAWRSLMGLLKNANLKIGKLMIEGHVPHTTPEGWKKLARRSLW
jgi:hypothetical protein